MKRLLVTMSAVVLMSCLFANAAHAITYYSWDPGILNERYRMLDSSGLGDCMGEDCLECCPEAQSYRMSTTTEDWNYTNGNADHVWWGHPIWRVDWNGPSPYALNWAINKYDYDYFRDKHVFAGLNEALDYTGGNGLPVLTDGYIDFRALLVSSRSKNVGGSIGQSKQRAMIGVVAEWNGRVHYLEINLHKTANYDNISTTVNVDSSPSGWPWYDTSDGVYDRHAYYSGGDIVYYNGPEIEHLPGCNSSYNVAQLTSNLQSYHINISGIMRSTVWSDYPSSWSGIYITGIYLGVEVWGAGSENIAFDNLKVYKY